MQKVVFLDIDGVLNNKDTKELTPRGFIGIDNNLLVNLKFLVGSTESSIILTSSWKDMQNTDEDYVYLADKFKSAGLEISDKTYEEWASKRGVGIRNYLNSHDDIQEYVIIDDFNFDFYEQDLYPHFVWTDPANGLTKEDADRALEILNGNLDLCLKITYVIQ